MAERETERVIHTESRRGGGTTVAVIVALIALLVVLYFVFGRGMMGGAETTDIKADVDVSAPATGGSGS